MKSLLRKNPTDPAAGPITINGLSAIYDAFGRTVEVNNGAKQILYGPSGQKFAYMSGQSVQNFFVALAGGVQAVYTGSGIQGYRHADWLGSMRFETNTAGAVTSDRAYAPYGESYAETGTADRMYTGQTQDAIAGPTGMYDFLFRQYSPSQSRWIVPDPAGLAAVDLTNPQTWNRYAYVGNNPLSNIDPLGLDPVGPVTTITVYGFDPFNIGSYYSGDFGIGGGSGNPNRLQLLPLDGPGEGRGGGRRPRSQPQPAPSNPPTKGNCTAQRIYSGLMGTANLAVAIGKGFAIGTAVASVGATGVGAPAAATLAVYGTTSVFGQGLAGATQLYSAFTGNYGTAGKVAQAANILAGPAMGFGTLIAGGTMQTAERQASYESFATALGSLVDAIKGSAQALPSAVGDESTSYFGAFATGDNPCGSGH
jgi:RHS repeat-associated protein